MLNRLGAGRLPQAVDFLDDSPGLRGLGTKVLIDCFIGGLDGTAESVAVRRGEEIACLAELLFQAKAELLHVVQLPAAGAADAVQKDVAVVRGQGLPKALADEDPCCIVDVTGQCDVLIDLM